MAQAKRLLSISQVFSLIGPGHGKRSIVVIPETKQVVPLSRNLIYLKRLGDLACSICGTNGTHLQQHWHGPREIWRVMAWSKLKERQTFLNVDHIIPRCRGGRWALDNLRVTCEDCNSARGHVKIIDEGDVEPVYTVRQIKHLIRLANLHGKKATLDVRLEDFESRLRKSVISMGISPKRVPRTALFKVLEPAMSAGGFSLTGKLRHIIAESGV